MLLDMDIPVISTIKRINEITEKEREFADPWSADDFDKAHNIACDRMLDF
jgi:hypothetical protein